jgi:integrase
MARQRSGTLVWRKKGWCARVTVGQGDEARREWRALGTTVRAVAVRRLAKLLAELEAGEPSAPAKRGAETLADYADGWLAARDARGLASVDDERRSLKLHVLEALGDRELRAIRPAQIREVLDAAVATGLKQNTLKNLRALLHRLFKAAWIDELVAENPVARVPTPKLREVQKRRTILTDEELRRFLAHPDVDLEIKMLALCARTVGGQRSGDLHALRWEAFGPSFATCQVPRHKTGKPQELDVPEVVQPFIAAWHELHGSPTSGPVFPVRRGKRAGEHKAPNTNANAKRLRTALLVAAVDRHELHHETAATLPTDFHSLRRAFSTALARANVNAQTAQALTGHTDPRVHMRYVAAEQLRTLPPGAAPTLDPSLAAGLLSHAVTIRGRRRGQLRSHLGDLNPRPAVYETAALPLS